MNKEEMTTKIQEDLKNNNKVWDKSVNREIIFIILTAAFLIFSLYYLIVKLLSEQSVDNVLGVISAFGLTLMWACLADIYLNKSDNCRKKERYLKKAIWITKYWLTPTIDGLKLDQSFFKYNYSSDENMLAIEDVSNRIYMETKEKK